MKTYIKPSLNIININVEQTILTGSPINTYDDEKVSPKVSLSPIYDPFFDDDDDDYKW